jgi:hypothetical protein
MATFEVGTLVATRNTDNYPDGTLFRVVGHTANFIGKPLVDVARYETRDTYTRSTCFYPYELRLATPEDVRNAHLGDLRSILLNDRAAQLDEAVSKLDEDDRRGRALRRLLDELDRVLDPDTCEVCFSSCCGGAYGGLCGK